MANRGSAATICRAASTVSVPNWKFSIRCWTSRSFCFASADLVVHSKRFGFGAASATAAPADSAAASAAGKSLVFIVVRPPS